MRDQIKVLLIVSYLGFTAAFSKLSRDIRHLKKNKSGKGASKGKSGKSLKGKGGTIKSKKAGHNGGSGTNFCEDYSVTADISYPTNVDAALMLTNIVGLPTIFPEDSMAVGTMLELTSLTSSFGFLNLIFSGGDGIAPFTFQGEVQETVTSIFETSPVYSVSGNTVLKGQFLPNGTFVSAHFTFTWTDVDDENPGSFNGTMSVCSSDSTILNSVTTAAPSISAAPSESGAPSAIPSVSLQPSISNAPTRPPITFTPTNSGCKSIPGWYSILSVEYDCDWFSLDAYRCVDFGFLIGVEFLGQPSALTANDACCACGGGTSA
jgi:hypothetical protein